MSLRACAQLLRRLSMYNDKSTGKHEGPQLIMLDRSRVVNTASTASSREGCAPSTRQWISQIVHRGLAEPLFAHKHHPRLLELAALDHVKEYVAEAGVVREAPVVIVDQVLGPLPELDGHVPERPQSHAL